MRVIFLGNHTVGVRALDALRACADVIAVVAHPPDPEDGVRYASVHAHAQNLGLPVMRVTGRDPQLAALVQQARPDLVLSVDYRYLLPAQVYNIPGVTAINLHPGLLPKYRGRAPVNWAILNGETELGLTAHCIAAGPDCGDIVAQERFSLAVDEDAGDALAKLYPLYERMVRRVVGFVQSGHVPRRPQNHAEATQYPRRQPEDGAIDWTQTAERVHRLVRAVAAPYPGAFARLPGGGKLIVWKARALRDETHGAPGRILRTDGDARFVAGCGGGSLLVTRWSVAGAADFTPTAGTTFPIRMELQHA